MPNVKKQDVSVVSCVDIVDVVHKGVVNRGNLALRPSLLLIRHLYVRTIGNAKSKVTGHTVRVWSAMRINLQFKSSLSALECKNLSRSANLLSGLQPNEGNLSWNALVP